MNGNNLWTFWELISGSQGGFKNSFPRGKGWDFTKTSGDSLGRDKNNLDKTLILLLDVSVLLFSYLFKLNGKKFWLVYVSVLYIGSRLI